METVKTINPSKVSDNVKVLIEASPLRGSNGIIWGPDNKLYVGSVWHDAAFIVDPETGEMEKIEGSRGTDDMAFHPDGRLFFNWITTGLVGVMDTDGKVSVAEKLKLGNDGIAITKDGRIFISGQFADSHLYEIYPNSNKEPRMITDEGMRMSNGMDIGPDGKLYGSSWVTGEAIQIDMETGATTMVGDKQGAILSAAKFNSKGELHVMDAALGVIYKVNRENRTFELVAKTPYPATDNFCFGPDDRIFNTSAGDGYVHEITGMDSHRVIIPGGLGLSGGVTLLEKNGEQSLIVVDAFAIREFDPSTGVAINAVRGITMATDVGWMLTVSPYGDDSNQVVTSSWSQNFVKLWDTNTNSMIANFANFKFPTNAIAPRKDMIIFCEIGGAVKRFSPVAPDKATTLAEGLKQPFGLVYDNGDLYVSEDLGGRIVQILDDNQVIEPKVIKDGLSSPQGLAIADGKLYVVEAGKGQLLAIDLSSGDTKTVATGMEFSTGKLELSNTKNWARSSVAISGNTAYIGGAGAGNVYKVSL
ncbi:hypothetical protein OO013_09785 [Mangrovivirga sp. M17]|uniref:SMP-30/Gluconolactonase/LRE-like region domain-containing protein n=1 Tax=Mangrovivirga halotolerans TaxID=2993936 RepID=A0ABT3RSD3_9BACT|nr:hypothetical protein [Mangrovivirga halotolerans]MCX2744157.1 hypothetical protein [Mangrovivirga halotolerans]